MLASRKLAIAALTAAFAVGGGSAVAYGVMDKSVTLQVDGATRNVNGLASTVGDVLENNKITLSQYDSVTPSLDTPVSDGQTIVVEYAKPSTVTVVADGSTQTLSSYDKSVSDLLATLGVTVAEGDRLSVDKAAALESGMTVKVQRVTTEQVNETEEVPFTTTKENDATLAKGKTTVATPGVNGVKTKVFSVVKVDGVEESRTLVSEAVTTEPVAQVEKVGTKVAVTPKPVTPTTPTTAADPAAPAPAPAAGINLAREAMWERVARCESTNNWHINTGNGYYGGLQFATRTWLAYGGGQFAPRADLATREQQITVANRVFDDNGLAQWSCKG